MSEPEIQHRRGPNAGARSTYWAVGRFMLMTPKERGEAMVRRPLLASFLMASISIAVCVFMLIWIWVVAPRRRPLWEMGIAFAILVALWGYGFAAGYRSLLKRGRSPEADAASR